MPTPEDKIVQGAVAEVLSAVYEADFVGISYGFRPGRNPHMALDALHTAIMSQRVNWVLDADIRSFFAEVDHEWLLRMLAHRIADPRIVKLPASAGWGAVVAGRRPRERRVAGNRQGDAAGGGHQPAPRQHRPALRPRSQIPAVFGSSNGDGGGRAVVS